MLYLWHFEGWADEWKGNNVGISRLNYFLFTSVFIYHIIIIIIVPHVIVMSLKAAFSGLASLLDAYESASTSFLGTVQVIIENP